MVMGEGIRDEGEKGKPPGSIGEPGSPRQCATGNGTLPERSIFRQMPYR